MTRTGASRRATNSPAGLRQVVGDNIRARRLALGYTQRDLARVVGVPDLAVSRWERTRDRHMPNEENLTRVAVALRCKVADLYADPEGLAA